MQHQELESWGTREFINCGVEDLREAKSIANMADKLLSHPESSFSSCVGKAQRKAAWRIFSKDDVDISCGHYKETSLRCASESVVLVHHDTTDLNFSGHLCSEGLGDLGGGKNGKVILGLCVHSSLVTTVEGIPLGLISQKIWAPVVGGRSKRADYCPIEEKESYRWIEALRDIERYLYRVPKVIVVSDRESDFYEYIATPRRKETSLLFRARHLHRNIYVGKDKMKLGKVAFSSKTDVDVFLPKSKDRTARVARLEISWGEILCPPSYGKKGATFPLSLILAREINPPEGQKGIEWYLLTTDKIETAQDALARIDYYRKRWTIERWHYVLKQGLRVEKLQFDTFTSLSNAIGLLSIVAWQIYLLKKLAEEQEDIEPTEVLTTLQIEVLEKQAKKKIINLKQALLLIASLGGFVPSKKQPLAGEMTIWRGYKTLNLICQGYKLANPERYGT
jgi:hypothetical protein